MLVSSNSSETHSMVLQAKLNGKKIGFVPTMGALHQGHLSLVKHSKDETDFTVVSIFVNPTQFNDKQDLANYPRTMDKDLEMLASMQVDVVFAPEVNEIYSQPDTRVFDFGLLEQVMEGKHRPGHFNGVAQVVSKLFEIVPANKAYFGKKDFQQLAVIKALVKKLNIETEIVSCPIIREFNGLAMSSRNMLLNNDQKEAATNIYKVLSKAVNLVEKFSVKELVQWVETEINQVSLLNLEYFCIVNDNTLEEIIDWSELKKGATACIAVRCGNVRLIDNVSFK